MSDPQFNFSSHPPTSSTGSIDLYITITDFGSTPSPFDVNITVNTLGYQIGFVNNTTGQSYPTFGTLPAGGLLINDAALETFDDYHVVVTRLSTATGTSPINVTVNAPSSGISPATTTVTISGAPSPPPQPSPQPGTDGGDETNIIAIAGAVALGSLLVAAVVGSSGDMWDFRGFRGVAE